MSSPEPPRDETSSPPVASHWRRDITAALLCTVVTLAYAGSFGQLVFGGALAPFVGQAVLAALITGIVMNLVLSWRSSFHFTLGGADSNPSAILAATVASIAATLGAGSVAPASGLVPTVMVYLFGSAATCGLVVYFVGERGWGRYVRFIPYPVIGGFLAGTGYLLVAGAYKMMTGERLTPRFWENWEHVSPLFWSSAVTVALLLLVLSRRFKHYLVVPVIIVAAIVGIHLILRVIGLNFEDARAAGFLLDPLQIGRWSTPLTIDYRAVQWDVLVTHGKDIVAMTMVVVVASLLNTTSLEHATGVDADAGAELRAVGMGNVVASCAGGFVGMISFNRSWLSRKAGASTGWAARLCAGMVATIILFAPNVVGWLPRPVLTGLILYLGLNLLYTWMVESRRNMPALDHLIVVVIVAIIAGFGAVTGVAAGIMIACVSLAFTLSRNPAIRYRFTAHTRHANVERTESQRALLQQHGDELQGFVLQGILFFGSVNRVLEVLRSDLEHIRFLLLDFRLVQGIDGSSAVVLNRLQTLCHESGVQLVFTGLTSPTAVTLTRGGLNLADRSVHCFPDLDLGLEWCEERIISRQPTGDSTTIDETIDMEAEDLELLSQFERREVSVGELIIRHGAASTEMFVVLSGRVQVQISSSLEGQDFTKRLRTYGPGTLVGEMGFYSGEVRSADIHCIERATLIRITAQRLQELERENPGFAHRLHRYVINTLALRLRSANSEILQLL